MWLKIMPLFKICDTYAAMLYSVPFRLVCRGSQIRMLVYGPRPIESISAVPGCCREVVQGIDQNWTSMIQSHRVTLAVWYKRPV